MKGITPIISIIILLLVTVGLAAAAWTYMNNYLLTLTSKTIEIPHQTCVNGEDVLAVVHNMGTTNININNDVRIWDNAGNPVLGATWEDLDGGVITDIPAGDYARATVNCCTSGAGGDCPKTCAFQFVVAGRAQPVTVYCPGS